MRTETKTYCVGKNKKKKHQAALTDEKQDRDAALKPDYMSDTTLYICIKIVSC